MRSRLDPSFTQICGRVLPWPWPTLSPVYIRPGHGAAGAYYDYNYVDFPGASGKHSCCQRIHFPASHEWIVDTPHANMIAEASVFDSQRKMI